MIPKNFFARWGGGGGGGLDPISSNIVTWIGIMGLPKKKTSVGGHIVPYFFVPLFFVGDITLFPHATLFHTHTQILLPISSQSLYIFVSPRCLSLCFQEKVMGRVFWPTFVFFFFFFVFFLKKTFVVYLSLCHIHASFPFVVVLKMKVEMLYTPTEKRKREKKSTFPLL